MGVPNRQIGQSQEANLLHRISLQLESLAKIAGAQSIGNIAPLELDASTFTAWNNGKNNIPTNTSYGMFSVYRTTGSENTAIGYSSLSTINSGNQNTHLGTWSGASMNSGSLNTVAGSYTISGTSFNGSYNTGAAQGVFGGATANTGSYNTAIGIFALRNITTGNGNTAIGALALHNRTGGTLPGSYNIAAGYQSFRNAVGGDNNIGFVVELQDGQVNGSRNIIFDHRNKPGAGTNNDNVVFVGIDGTLPAANGQIYIGTANATRFFFNSLGELSIVTAPTNGTGVATEKVMLLDAVSDANGMASVKTVDYIDTNATTSALSLATLNSTYPGASVGFRVICMSVSGGALIYTKTGSTSWCSNTATATA